jgi:hypothetical protein
VNSKMSLVCRTERGGRAQKQGQLAGAGHQESAVAVIRWTGIDRPAEWLRLEHHLWGHHDLDHEDQKVYRR